VKRKVKKLPRPQVRLVDPLICEALTGSLAVPVSIVSLATGAGEYAVRRSIQSGDIPQREAGANAKVIEGATDPTALPAPAEFEKPRYKRSNRLLEHADTAIGPSRKRQ